MTPHRLYDSRLYLWSIVYLFDRKTPSNIGLRNSMVLNAWGQKHTFYTSACSTHCRTCVCCVLGKGRSRMSARFTRVEYHHESGGDFMWFSQSPSSHPLSISSDGKKYRFEMTWGPVNYMRYPCNVAPARQYGVFIYLFIDILQF